MPKGDQQRGIYGEIMEEIAQKTGDTFIIHYLPPKRGISYFDEGDIDFEVMVSPAWWGDSPPTNSEWSEPVLHSADIFILYPGPPLSSMETWPCYRL